MPPPYVRTQISIVAQGGEPQLHVAVGYRVKNPYFHGAYFEDRADAEYEAAMTPLATCTPVPMVSVDGKVWHDIGSSPGFEIKPRSQR